MQLKTYYKTTITQLGICTVKIEHNNKHEMCQFFVVLGNGKALLGIPDIDVLNIINININTTDMEDGKGTDNCCMNKATPQSANMMQETDRTEKCYTKTDSISKSDNTDKPMVDNKLPNTTDYFLPGTIHDSAKRASGKITQQLQRDFEDVFHGIGCFDGPFLLQLKPHSKPYQEPLRH